MTLQSEMLDGLFHKIKTYSIMFATSSQVKKKKKKSLTFEGSIYISKWKKKVWMTLAFAQNLTDFFGMATEA